MPSAARSWNGLGNSTVLEEYKKVSQQRNAPGYRRWFSDDELDLIVWYSASAEISGFQLCYDLGRRERAFTWRKDGGLIHTAVDSGDESPLYNRSPILVSDGSPPLEWILAEFKKRSENLEPAIVTLVSATVSSFHGNRKKVLFVCVENSCRSQIAEAFARMKASEVLEPFSSGSRPSGVVNVKAIESMRELGYDLNAHRSKSLLEIPDVEYDYVITMGCGDECPVVRARHREDWQIPDPKDLPPEEFRRMRDLIGLKVGALADSLRT